MTPERWAQVQTVIHDALAVPLEHRTAFVASACAGDLDLERDVQSLLVHASSVSAFLSTPAAFSTETRGDQPNLVGRSLGPYTVNSWLGGGGMGDVYLAHDTRLHRMVALKVLRQDGLTPEGRERLLREARAAAALNHPNIAAIYDILDSVDDPTTPPHIVMEYVDGETLSERVERGAVAVEDALRFGTEMAAALAAAHQQGIVHRDLKPANMRLTSSGHVKVLDFGLARRVTPTVSSSGLTLEQAQYSQAVLPIAGTPGYMSPEQALGQPVGPSSDVFSLGIVMFELLTGRRPFPGENFLASALAAVALEPPSVARAAADIPPALDALVTRMLAKEPRERPTAAAVVDELEKCSKTGVSNSTPVRRLLYAAAVVGILVIGVVEGVRLWRSPSGTRPVARPTIAVLPLANLSGDNEKEYLGIGIAEALTTSLARVSSVSVISRTNLSDVPRGADARTIARDLGATLVLQGSVQQSGDRLRVNAKLLAPDGSVTWGGEVDSLIADLFTLETRLAAAVISGLQVKVSTEEQQRAIAPPTRNAEALDLYWQGLAFMDRSSPASVARAAASFEKAAALDPRFAAALGELGEAYRRQYTTTADKAWIEKAMAATSRGLAIDPSRTEVRISLATLYGQTGRAPEAIDELRKVTAQHPDNDEARRRLAAMLNEVGNAKEALAEYQTAATLRPEYWRNHQALGLFFYNQKRLPEAVNSFTRVIEIRPEDANAYLQRGSALQAMGQTARARADYDRSIALEPNAPAYSNVGFLDYAEGRYEDAAKAFAAAITLRPKRAVYHRNLGDAYLKLKRADDAREAYLTAIKLTQETLAVNPNDATALSQLAVYEAKIGRSRDARQHADDAVAKNATSPEVLFRRGVALALSGDDAAAVAALTDAVDHGYSVEQIQTEDDLARLANVPGFRQLVARKPSTKEKDR